MTLTYGKFGFFLLSQSEGETEEKPFTQVVLGPVPACVQDVKGGDDRDFSDTLYDWNEVEKVLAEYYDATVSVRYSEPAPVPRM